MKKVHREAFVGSLTPARFAPYLKEASDFFKTSGEQEEKALELYIWATELAGLYQIQIAFLEVALRNALSQQLAAWNKAQPSEKGIHFSSDWTSQRAEGLRDLVNSRNISAAIIQAKQDKPWKESYKPSYDDIISKLTFGFWHSLLVDETTVTTHVSFRGLSDEERRSKVRARRLRNRRRDRLWKDALHKAFPYRETGGSLEAERGQIARQVDSIRTLRNRIAHHDNILQVHYTERNADIRSLLQSMGSSPYKALVYLKLEEHLSLDPRKYWST